MINIVLFGPPGSGKGTQASKLVEKYGFVHVSTGDLFRYELGNNTELGQLARSFMDRGELVPDEVTTQMLLHKVESLGEEVPGIIFDGYPRNVNQAQALEDLLEETERGEVTILIALKVEDDTIVERIMKRGEVSGRKDDQEEKTIRKRIDIYKKETTPVYSFFDAHDKALLVDGSGTVEDVFDELCGTMDHFLEEA